MEQTNEYQTTGKDFMITTKTDYKITVKEINAMLKYIYLDREEYEQMPYHSKTIRIIHTKFSTYVQALILFYEDNPVPKKSQTNS